MPGRFSRVRRAFIDFLKGEEGPTAVEYALMLAAHYRRVRQRHPDPRQQ